MEVGSGGYLPNCEAASRLISTSSRRRWGEYMYFFSDILKQCDNMTQKDGFNSAIPFTITIFSDKNPALVARRWLEKDIRRFKSQSAHAFNAVYRYSIIVMWIIDINNFVIVLIQIDFLIPAVFYSYQTE